MSKLECICCKKRVWASNYKRKKYRDKYVCFQCIKKVITYLYNKVKNEKRIIRQEK